MAPVGTDYQERLADARAHSHARAFSALPRPKSPPPRASKQKPATAHHSDADLDGFSGPDACTLAGISYRQLDYWARTDFVRPSLNDAAGSGTSRRYSHGDIVKLNIVKALLDAGVKLAGARTAIALLVDGDDWDRGYLVLNGPASVLVRTDSELVDVVRKGQTVLSLVPLAVIVGTVDKRILDLTERKGLVSAA